MVGDDQERTSSSGTSCSAGVIEPWLPTMADSLGSRSEAMITTSSWAAAMTSPRRA